MRTRVVMDRLVARTPGEGADTEPRTQWSVFTAAVAQEFGLQPSALLRHWTLAELVSGHGLAGEAHRRAAAAAKKRGPDGDPLALRAD